MQYNMFQGNQPFGSGEEIKSFLPNMGMVKMLVMSIRQFEQYFLPTNSGGYV